MRSQPLASGLHWDDVTLGARSLALDTKQPPTDFEHEVVPAMLGHRAKNVDAEARRLSRDLQLRDVALQVGVVTGHERMFASGSDGKSAQPASWAWQ
jgi:hypothetical protein